MTKKANTYEIIFKKAGAVSRNEGEIYRERPICFSDFRNVSTAIAGLI